MIRSCSARLQRTYASLQPWPWHCFLLPGWCTNGCAGRRRTESQRRGFQSTHIDRCRFENDAAKTLTVVHPHDKKTEKYEGVALEEILHKAGVPQGEALRGPAMATYVVAEGADGYRVFSRWRNWIPELPTLKYSLPTPWTAPRWAIS